jgi:hypothetical protein
MSKSCQKVVKKLSKSCQKFSKVVTKSCHHRTNTQTQNSKNPENLKPENLNEDATKNRWSCQKEETTKNGMKNEERDEIVD